MDKTQLYRGICIEQGQYYGTWQEGYFCLNSYIDDNNYSVIVQKVTDNGLVNYRVHKDTLERHTGHSDFYGNVVYAGNILKYMDNVYGIVKYGEKDKNVGFYIDWLTLKPDSLRSDLLFWLKHEYCRVVGDIHQNPELIQGQIHTYKAKRLMDGEWISGMLIKNGKYAAILCWEEYLSEYNMYDIALNTLCRYVDFKDEKGMFCRE